ncbi:MAG: hypothetical protein QOG63_2129, partial [Thermoleophilaceae bacterium]|nr:hypothetical protein [Thermoleophilaceae bacterium]
LRAATAIADGHGAAVLRARAGEMDRDFPFGAVRQLFEPVLAGAAPAEREDLLAGAAALARGILDEDPGSAAAPAMQAALHGLYWLCANLASSRPLLIVVDDAHWADPPSLRWLEYLARRIDRLAVTVAVAVRSGEESSDSALLAAIESAAAASIRPRPLGIAAVAEVARRLLAEDPDDAFVEACLEATGGNPFLLRALCADLRDEGIRPTAAESGRAARLGSSTVARATAARLERLGPGAAATARAVAILGDGSSVADAAALAGLDPAQTSRAADNLARADILAPGRPLSFVHPILRAAVYEEIALADRAEAHHSAAALLAERGAPPDRVAAHLLATEPSGQAQVVARLRDAARDAVSRGAPESAVPYLRRALAEPPEPGVRLEVVLESGLAEAASGMPDSERKLLAVLHESGSATMRAAAARALIPLFLWQERGEDAMVEVEPLIDELAETDRELALRLEGELLATTRVGATTRASCVRRLAGRSPPDPPRSVGERMLLANLAVEATMRPEPAEIAIDLAERALGEGELLATAGPDSPLVLSVMRVLSITERFGAAFRNLEQAVRAAQEHGNVIGFAVASMFLSEAAYRTGDLSRAEADGRAAVEITTEHGWLVGMQGAATFLIDVLIERDELDEAFSIAARADLTAGRLATYGSVMAARSFGRLQLAAGQLEPGVRTCLDCGRADRDWIADSGSVIPWRSTVAPGLRALGDRDQAWRLAEEELAIVRRVGVPRAIGVALLAAGVVDLNGDGLELLREAVVTLERSEARLEHARALVELGAALRRGGTLGEARELLAAGGEAAHRLGAVAVAERARDELVRAGAKPRRHALTGVDSLTASERRVADLAADGLSNRDIAQSLFVTVKTVELHLSSAYRKLGIRSRTQLAAALPRRRPALS